MTGEQTLTPHDPAAGVVIDPYALRDSQSDKNDALPAGTEAGGDAPADGGGDAEAAAAKELAKSRGWVDEKDWKGKGQWTDAKAYNDRYESIMPVVTRENKRLRDELKELRDRDVARDNQIKELAKFQQEQNEARAKIQHQTLLAERAAAIEQNDTQRIVQIDDQLMDLKVAARAAPPQKPAAPQFDPNLKRIEEDFIADNPIFREPEMYEALTEAAALARAAGSPLQGREFLDKLKAKVERWYPDKFTTTTRRPAMAEMNGAPGRASGGRTWNDLSADARDALDKFIRNSPTHMKLGIEKARASILKNTPDSYFRK